MPRVLPQADGCNAYSVKNLRPSAGWGILGRVGVSRCKREIRQHGVTPHVGGRGPPDTTVGRFRT